MWKVIFRFTLQENFLKNVWEKIKIMVKFINLKITLININFIIIIKLILNFLILWYFAPLWKGKFSNGMWKKDRNNGRGGGGFEKVFKK
jgi:hypothetical protein